MKEDAVYVATKSWFIQSGYKALAGQPPNGCDNIPTIEIKEPSNQGKGSKGSYKPDLVFANERFLILVECKPSHSDADLQKLVEIQTHAKRKQLLYNELVQRRIFSRVDLESCFSTFEDFEKKLRFCLSHAGTPVVSENIGVLVFKSLSQPGTIIMPSNSAFSF
jgi:hypothetical protein